MGKSQQFRGDHFCFSTNHYQWVEGLFSSLACPFCPLFCFFTFFLEMILNRSQDYPGKFERNLAATHARDIQWNYRMYTYYKKFQPVPTNFTLNNLRHNSPSSTSLHSSPILFSDLSTFTDGSIFHLITQLGNLNIIFCYFLKYTSH